MTEEKMDATTAKLKALLDAGNIDLKNPETVSLYRPQNTFTQAQFST